MISNINLTLLPSLHTLFRWFNSGKHLNRISNAALWAELEQQQTAYTALFTAMGYELCMDGRGFAWFNQDEVSLNLSNQSRQLALLFMIIFNTQADSGKSFGEFISWRIDQEFMLEVFKQNQDILLAENLTIDTLIQLLDKAHHFGFVAKQSGYWQLLPAVFRYLDHIEALADQMRQQEVSVGELLDDEENDA